VGSHRVPAAVPGPAVSPRVRVVVPAGPAVPVVPVVVVPVVAPAVARAVSVAHRDGRSVVVAATRTNSSRST